jgi:hypothetical protein
VASALQHAGIQMIDAGAFNDGLKAYQLGMIRLGADGSETSAWLHGESAVPWGSSLYQVGLVIK